MTAQSFCGNECDRNHRPAVPPGAAAFVPKLLLLKGRVCCTQDTAGPPLLWWEGHRALCHKLKEEVTLNYKTCRGASVLSDHREREIVKRLPLPQGKDCLSSRPHIVCSTEAEVEFGPVDLQGLKGRSWWFHQHLPHPARLLPGHTLMLLGREANPRTAQLSRSPATTCQ